MAAADATTEAVSEVETEIVSEGEWERERQRRRELRARRRQWGMGVRRDTPKWLADRVISLARRRAELSRELGVPQEDLGVFQTPSRRCPHIYVYVIPYVYLGP